MNTFINFSYVTDIQDLIQNTSCKINFNLNVIFKQNYFINS